MRSFILILPLSFAVLFLLARPAPQSVSTLPSPADSLTTAELARDAAHAIPDSVGMKRSMTAEHLARSETVEVSGACVHLEAVAEWEIPPPHERTEKKVKLVIKNNSGILMTLPHRGVNDIRLNRAGDEVSQTGGGRFRSNVAMPLMLEPDENGVIVIRAVLYWHHGKLRLSFHDEMARMWSFKDIEAGAYEISAEYYPGKVSRKIGDWTGEAITADLRIRLVAPVDAALENLDF